ncbi:hypothetical protein, partial [Pantoea agglomerans]|uniref:hypothetical protein n=1 Tax=Enterobacter agglomerans TaxID=549 RepID=UPI001F5C5369
NAGGQPLQHDEWAQGMHRLQILLSGRWLITINATDTVNDIGNHRNAKFFDPLSGCESDRLFSV